MLTELMVFGVDKHIGLLYNYFRMNARDKSKRFTLIMILFHRAGVLYSGGELIILVFDWIIVSDYKIIFWFWRGYVDHSHKLFQKSPNL